MYMKIGNTKIKQSYSELFILRLLNLGKKKLILVYSIKFC